MKRLTLLGALIWLCLATYAQHDTAMHIIKHDTIRIGNILIVKEGKRMNIKGKGNNLADSITENQEIKHHSRSRTSWMNFDIGFSNYVDNTNYGATGNYLVNRPGYPPLGNSDFKLRTGKSINVNIWIMVQHLNLIKNNVNLKYAFGLELNNYRYTSAISYKKGGDLPYTAGLQSSSAFIFRDSIAFKKNKLAADYFTVPILLNFITNPEDNNKGLSLSFGVSAGYLYSQRNKQVSSDRGKEKNKGDYDLEKFKFSYVAELGLGPIRIYGSYSPKSMYQQGLDMKPYTLGFRFSNW